jgi:hypothetical protein
MKLLVCGSRDWDDRLIFGLILRGFWDKFGKDLEIIEGCARGADTMAEEFAKQFGLVCHHFPADWNAYEPAQKWKAGHDRNRKMLEQGKPGMVVAFKDGLYPRLKKGGTENMVRIAKEASIQVMVVGRGPGLGDQGRLL